MYSHYAFATAHLHGAIYQERGLLTAEGKTIKNKEEILWLLKALWLPKKLAIIHCPGHQRNNTKIAVGNNLADRTAKSVALQETTDVLAAILPEPPDPNLPNAPWYTKEEIQWAKNQPMSQCLEGWWHSSEGKLILPNSLARTILKKIHRVTHMGSKRMADAVRQSKVTFRDIHKTIDDIVTNCKACQLTNATNQSQHPGTRLRGKRPGAYWEVDFTEIKPGKYGYKYLLVFVDTFSRWTEAFPTKDETAQIVAKKLLEDILPRYGFPHMIGSDNGPAFVSKVSQNVAKFIGADWRLHCAYRPQSSGQVERMNRTLKETLTKLTLETGADWVMLLPFALYRVRNSPYQLGLTPFEILYGMPAPIIPNLKTDAIAEMDEDDLLFRVKATQWAHKHVWPKLRALYEAGPVPEPHKFRPGDWVFVKRFRQNTLEPRWKGPYIILLTTPTAIKVDGIAAWIHYSHARPANPFSVPEDYLTPAAPEWKVSKDNANRSS
ncbi:protein NYNRIN-like isoform X1 [Meriones unguiculatus]|uniref:protein NYNRIN-like isoform X1 n=1 Tax=Meriones unguiculatus TaxID=10047 RepID=UPI00293E06C3|nr:protein NYNRIN-like isoform X1 [Meriones unguiculatus]XP_060222451.1 protein NYNRIN-like isoform X1 [Meriones unguiculatus]